MRPFSISSSRAALYDLLRPSHHEPGHVSDDNFQFGVGQPDLVGAANESRVLGFVRARHRLAPKFEGNVYVREEGARVFRQFFAHLRPRLYDAQAPEKASNNSAIWRGIQPFRR